jgi:hypothetical protein
MFVGVNLEDDSATGHVFCGERDLGGCGATRATPVGPEVDKNGNTRGADDLVEELGVNLQGLIERRYGRFACATSASVGEMISSEAVFLATVLAGSYRGHEVAPAD